MWGVGGGGAFGCTLSLIIQERSSGEGDPTTLRIWLSWSRSELSQGLQQPIDRPTHADMNTRYTGDTMLSREDGSIGEQLCQDTSNGPDINWEREAGSSQATMTLLLPSSLTGLGVALGVQHDLRSSVPPRGNVLSQEASVVMLRVCYSGQTKVTDLEEGERGTQLK